MKHAISSLRAVFYIDDEVQRYSQHFCAPKKGLTVPFWRLGIQDETTAISESFLASNPSRIIDY
jgi:hypothetical protein